MVSHHHLLPYPRSSAPASSVLPLPTASVPRASSVTSGGSHTRRHRHARSHHGSSSSAHLPQNEFPVFSHTGDVEIVITSANGRKENRYLLHRLILSQCSGFFEAGTRAEWSGRVMQGPGSDDSAVAGMSSSRRSSYEKQAAQRWSYVLDWQSAEHDEAMLVQKRDSGSSLFGGGGGPLPVRNKPPASNEKFFRSMTNFSSLNLNEHSQASAPLESGDEVLRDYDNLFRTMYQYPPALDTVNIATAYTECKALLHLADMYDALEIVGSRVDHHLLRFGARLFKQIAKYPPSYLKLGYLARSRTIFTEALIHVVGQWPSAAPQLRGQIDAAVTELIEDKVDEMQELQERIEFKLWRLNLTTARGDRVTPSNDYLSWLGISLFRQWLAENTTPAPAPILKHTNLGAVSTHHRMNNASRVSVFPGSNSSNHIASQRTAPPPAPTPPSAGRVYRLLGSSDPSAYLNHDDVKRFLRLQPDLYTRENLRRFERRLDEIKTLARDAVMPLMRNYLELDLGSFGPGGLGYLTCARLGATELPWDD